MSKHQLQSKKGSNKIIHRLKYRQQWSAIKVKEGEKKQGVKKQQAICELC